jgi:hypothetical protein
MEKRGLRGFKYKWIKNRRRWLEIIGKGDDFIGN